LEVGPGFHPEPFVKPLENFEMKKTLVALAAIAATSAFADVSITGFIDQAYNRTAVTSAANARTSSSNIGSNAIGQDQITFGITEDMGDGMTAYANIRVKPDVSAGSMAGDVSNVGLKGAFGNVQFASDYGTTWYTANMSDASGWGSGAGNVHGPLVGGTNDAIIYTLPTMVQGLGVTVASVAGGDATGKGAGNATAYMLSYGIGALNIQYAGARGKTSSKAGSLTQWTTSSNVGTNPATPTTAGSVLEDITAGSTSTQNALALTYDLGMAKLYFGTTSGKSGGDADQKASSSTYGVSIPFGAASIGIASSSASRTSAAAVEEKETGYRILGKYALSKRTTAYVQNGTSKVSGTSRATTSTGLGLTHNF
jgi:predicted porin